MKQQSLKLLLLIILSNTTIAYAGELLFRSGTPALGGLINPKCSLTITGEQYLYDYSSGRGLYSVPIQTLSCTEYGTTNQIISYYQSNLSCTIKTQVPIGYTLSQLNNSSCAMMISKTSDNNVFLYRSLSKSYLPYSNDGVLDKPIIFVEGYDPKNENGYDKYYYDKGLKDLVLSGRDLFIIKFQENAESMDSNAQILENIILEINAAKKGNIPAVVIGYSMGGIIARKALKDMEVKKINHNTSLYISLDSPHLGANLPKTIPENINGLISMLDEALMGYTPSALSRARYSYNSPAARELLIEGPDAQAITYNSFPSQLVRIAVTSGSLNGTLQSNSISADNVGITIANYDIGFKKEDVIFGTDVEWSTNQTWRAKTLGNPEIYYDNTPGSYLNTFDTALKEMQIGASKFVLHESIQGLNVTFIPTMSALAINGISATENALNYFYTKSPFDRFIAETTSSNPSSCNTTEISIGGETNGKNMRHDIFSPSQKNQINCAINQYQKADFIIPDRTMKIGFTSCGINSGKVYASNISTSSVNTLLPAAQTFCGQCGITVTAGATNGYTSTPLLTIKCK